MLSARERRSVVPALFVSGVAVLALVASLSPAQTRLALEQDGMAMGSGGLPLAMGDDDANGPAAQPTSNSFLDAIESSVTAARAVRQALGGPSMRVAAGRSQLQQLPADKRAAETRTAAETLQNYMAQEQALQAEQAQILAQQKEPEVSGMSIGSGGRPLPMHLAVQAESDEDKAERKAHDSKMLVLFDKLSPETQRLLLRQKPGLSLQESAAATARQIQNGDSADHDGMKSRTQMLWNAQETQPYNPMQRVSQTQKVNKMITNWQSRADSEPAGSYTDY